MLNFNSSQKGLGLVSLPHFVYDLSCYILLNDQILLYGCQYWAVIEQYVY